ncbi:hypothetical protein [Tabrizicola sp.]|uniref:hypothetical protein n=1 Tax=Tabrizicola sp. TaxID=2005166 RepID=UPI002FDD1614
MADQEHYKTYVRETRTTESSGGSMALIVGGLVVAVGFILWLIFGTSGAVVPTAPVSDTTNVTIQPPAAPADTTTNVTIDPAPDTAAPLEPAPADGAAEPAAPAEPATPPANP